MKLLDWIILLIVALAVAGAIYAIRNGKAGGCCGNCAACEKNCVERDKKDRKK